MSQNWDGEGKSHVSVTKKSNSPHSHSCASDRPMKQGKGKQHNGVIDKSNNGEFLLLPDCSNTCHYINQNILCLFPFISLDVRRRRSGSKNSRGHNHDSRRPYPATSSDNHWDSDRRQTRNKRVKGSLGMKQQPDDNYESESSTNSDNSAETDDGDNNEEVLKTDLVLSGSPGSISSIGNSGVSQKELEEENTLLKKRNASMEKILQSNSAYFGKNKCRIKYRLSSQDQLNRRTAVLFIKCDMFPRIQILPEMWYLYSPLVGMTVCGKIMSLLTIPEGYTAKSYWENVFCAIFSEAWAVVRSNYMVTVSATFLGTLLHVIHC